MFICFEGRETTWALARRGAVTKKSEQQLYEISYVGRVLGYSNPDLRCGLAYAGDRGPG